MNLRNLRDQIENRFKCGGILGKSSQICKCLHLAGEVARTETTVLLVGESGTGKELISRAIHQNSDRKSGPYIPVNCAAIPQTLLEAELFGYEAGAFTGAVRGKQGKFETASHGTLFLDEVGDLSLDSQTKLLRVLEEKRFQRLGGVGFVDVDVRIIAATNRNLPKMVSKGLFREDLYYRLSVFPIQIPPLRIRGNDILILAEYFIDMFSRSFGKKAPHLTDEAKKCLLDHPWKGNVRELKNVIERAMVLCKQKKIMRKHLNLNDISAPEYPKAEIDKFVKFLLTDRNFSLQNLEARILYHAVRSTDYNVSKASRLLGLSRSALRYRLEKYHRVIARISEYEETPPTQFSY